MSRNRVLRIGLLTVMAVIVTRLFFIQIVQHEEWVEKAAAQQTKQTVLKAKRGEIYMLDGGEPVAVAMNATVYTVIVDPMLADREEIAEKVSAIVGDKQTATWDDVFANKAMRYYIVAKNVERKAAEQIVEADLGGVWLQASTKRVYPEKTLGSTLLGFVNADGIGQYGVEGALNKQLSGTDGLLKTVKDINNVALSIGNDNIKEPAVDGENIVLTIDKNIQYNVEKILEGKSTELGVANLSAIVMDPRDGRVLAMANYPGYDPGDYGNVNSAADYINHVVEDPYEPASTCKALTFAAGLETGVFSPESTYFNAHKVTIDGWPIENASQDDAVYGAISMQTALSWSLNTGSIQVLRWLGGSDSEITDLSRERLYDYYYNKFGLGRETGIELIESAGYIVEPNADVYGLASTYANMTFGQNLQVTMLQMAAALSAIVNGGNYYTPTIVAGTMRGGEFVAKATAEPERQVVSEQTSATMREMLYNVRRAFNTTLDAPGYYVGGKTGTAQAIKDGAYSFDELVGSYLGFGGADGEMPEYVIMTRIWDDGSGTRNGQEAQRAFNAISNYMIDYLKIKPGVTE